MLISVSGIYLQGEKKDFSWENAKKMMAKVDSFKEKLETYRGEDIPEDTITRVSPMLEDPEFTFEKMKSKSAAAGVPFYLRKCSKLFIRNATMPHYSESLQLGGEYHSLQRHLQAREAFDGVFRRGNKIKAEGDGRSRSGERAVGSH